MKSDSLRALFRKMLSLYSSLRVNVGKRINGPRTGGSGKNVISGMMAGISGAWAEARDALHSRPSAIARVVRERTRSTARFVPHGAVRAKGLFQALGVSRRRNAC